jgi:hypothetical protein
VGKNSEFKEEVLPMEAKDLEPGPNVLDIINLIPMMQHNADRFSNAHPEHSGDVQTFLQELRRIVSELQSSVYARERMKDEQGEIF